MKGKAGRKGTAGRSATVNARTQEAMEALARFIAGRQGTRDCPRGIFMEALNHRGLKSDDNVFQQRGAKGGPHSPNQVTARSPCASLSEESQEAIEALAV